MNRGASILCACMMLLCPMAGFAEEGPGETLAGGNPEETLAGGTVTAGIAGYRNTVKVSFVSWFSGTTKLSYERATGRRHTDEITIGRIGWGYDRLNISPTGWTFRYAHKFMLTSRGDSPLEGWYVRPELVWTKFDYKRAATEERITSKMAAVFATCGYQLVYRRFVLDCYAGLGAGSGETTGTYYQHGFITLNYFGDIWPHPALTAGIKVGIAF